MKPQSKKPDIKKLKKLALVASLKDSGQVTLLKHIDSLEETLLGSLEGVKDKIEEVRNEIPDISVIQGEKGENGASVDKKEIIDDIMSMVEPNIPTVEEIVSKIKMPTNGKDGHNPLTVSLTPPLNPKKGDLWYKN